MQHSTARQYNDDSGFFSPQRNSWTVFSAICASVNSNFALFVTTKCLSYVMLSMHLNSFLPKYVRTELSRRKKKAKHLFRLLQIFCFYFRRSCRSFYQSLLFVLFINSLCLHFQGMYDWLFFSLHVCKREEFTGLKTMPTLCHLVQEGERTN